jgi:hypothetical protein
MKLFGAFFIFLALVLLLIGSYNALMAAERSQIDVLILAHTAMMIGITLGSLGGKRQ